VSYQPRLKLPTEFALAAACCRWAYSGEGAEELGAVMEVAVGPAGGAAVGGPEAELVGVGEAGAGEVGEHRLA